MKVIIPAAGYGVRLFPHTYTKPKLMVYIAGKPIIAHILDRMIELEPEEVILIVGYRKEQIILYIDKYYKNILNIRYVDQKEILGLGHAVYITRNIVGDSNIMIVLGDMIFKSGYLDFYNQCIKNNNCIGSVGIQKIDDPQKYGIVELEPRSKYIKRLEEKPKKSTSNLGIVGIYFIQNTKILFEVLERMFKDNIKTHGEYQLTDALQEMVKRKNRLDTFIVSDWYDCGHTESLLKANKVLLDEKEELNNRHNISDSVIIHPVAIGEHVQVVNSVIGPHISIADDSIIDNSIISNSIIGFRTHISMLNLQSSVIGNDVNIIGKCASLNIGDSSSLEI